MNSFLEIIFLRKTYGLCSRDFVETGENLSSYFLALQMRNWNNLYVSGLLKARVNERVGILVSLNQVFL